MTHDRSTRTTRRGVLALLGTTAAAGCTGLPSTPFGDREVRIDGAALRALAERPTPVVPETVPVGIERQYLRRRSGDVRELLAVAPTPLDRREVPNGAIREKLASTHDRATEALAASEDAPSPYEAMRSIRRARGEAGELAAAWRAIDAGLTRADLLDPAATVLEAVREFDDEWEYVGADSVRVVLVGERIERGVARAIEAASVDRERFGFEQENPITVGELGGDVERARGLLDDATHLYDRYTGSLSGGTDRESTIRSAAESAVAAVDRRQEDLPAFDPRDPSAAFDRDVEDTPAAWALRDLYEGATHTRGIDHARSNEALGPASVVLLAQETLTRLRAFASLYDRVAGGERVALADAGDVEAIRSDAVRAIETARSEATHPRLARRVLADVAGTIPFADRELADVRDEIEPRWLARDVGIYLRTGAVARAVPAASERIASTLADAG